MYFRRMENKAMVRCSAHNIADAYRSVKFLGMQEQLGSSEGIKGQNGLSGVTCLEDCFFAC